ncbi:hypothetical protein [Mesobacterium pallidum]|uniref:hypothetical protein n=1 Tax=Mesobacterium pallidum TaxID=2872037 RepID=UPI001EE2ED65|nr:hypothetical protein [Mesobacterium pallidum]
MTLEDIKAAVDVGQTVHWVNTGYVVHKDRLGQYLISFLPNGSCIGLTDREGHRLNGKEAEFFVARSKDAAEIPGNQSRPDGQGRGVAPGGAGAFPLGRVTSVKVV